MSQDHNRLNHDMGVQVPCRVHAEVPQETVVGQIWRQLENIFRELAGRKECQIEEGT